MAIIDETARGQVRFEGNELLVDVKGPVEHADPDPSKVRVGSEYVPGECGGGGGFSHDVIDRVGPGQRRVEAVVHNGGFNGRTGEYSLNIWNGRDFGDIRDSDQIKVMEATAEGIEFKVPVKAAGWATTASILQSPDGRLQLICQGDGNLVLYKDGQPVRALFGLGSEQTW